ncbi:hypothetical protein A0H81_00977 [Grifola frondosa]|uniref:Adipose-regulatory protein-domain-containing protein n=1 Tax=Grifola frondosa TaxID=5627 RepID=A0A1C7MNW7_GRIFR|nr:hypothetical protein A0H81_00977 [Grifola frondosa]
MLTALLITYGLSSIRRSYSLTSSLLDFVYFYGDGRSPFAEVELQNLVAQQPYDISAHLVVPAVEANYALGNFMATLTIVAPSNKTMAHIRRPALVLPPSSSHLSFLYSKPGTVDLHIPLLYSFEADTTRATARIELGRIDQWRSLGNGAGRELSVSSASLRGLVVHEGFRGIITRFPTISAIAASGIFFFIGFVILASCLLPALQWHFPEDETPEKGAAEKTVRSSRRRFQFEVDSRSARRPKTPRRSQSETSHRSFKGEEIVADIPPATFGTTTPLRRRRSRGCVTLLSRTRSGSISRSDRTNEYRWIQSH